VNRPGFNGAYEDQAGSTASEVDALGMGLTFLRPRATLRVLLFVCL